MLSTFTHYRVLEKIGEGGMGEVYKAFDTRLGRNVALKLLPSELASDELRLRRFIQEARSASVLSHPNICTIYETGESRDGRPFIAMEFVPGATLAAKIKGGPLAPLELLYISIQVADALQEAHSKGIVHRDVKPANIMINERGLVKVLDFGLAKRLVREAQGTDNLVTSQVETRDGLVVGTVPFMSPEQLLGTRADVRSDIFSLGVTLYEAATGTLPYTGETNAAVIDEILNKDPVPPRLLNPSLPVRLEEIINKAMDKDPELRYQSSLELKTDLMRAKISLKPTPATPATLPVTQDKRRPRIGRLAFILAGAAAITVLGVWIGRQIWGDHTDKAAFAARPADNHVAGSSPEAGRPAAMALRDLHLAVIPSPDVRSGSIERAQSNGMAVLLAVKLQTLARYDDRLTVESPNLLRAYGGTNVPNARRKLGVSAVVVVKVELRGEQNRLTMELWDAGTGYVMDRRVVEDHMANVSAIQGDSVAVLVDMLGVKAPDTLPLAASKSETSFPEALSLFLAGCGRVWTYGDAEDPEGAADLLRQAIAKDPGYAAAFWALSAAHWLKYRSTGDSRWVERAVESSRRAVDFDDTLAVAYTSLGNYLNTLGRFDEADEVLRKALDIDPCNILAYAYLATACEARNRGDEAEALCRRAVYRRPSYWFGRWSLGSLLLRKNQFEAAATEFLETAQLTPESSANHADLGALYLMLERWDDARDMLERSLAIEPNYVALANLGTLDMQTSRYADAIANYEKAIAMDDTDYKVWGNLALACRNIAGQEATVVSKTKKAIELAEASLIEGPSQASVFADLADYHVMLNDREKSRSYLARASAFPQLEAEVLAVIGSVHYKLGDRGQALRWMERALDQGYSPTMLERSPQLESLRADPGFRELIKKFRDGDASQRASPAKAAGGRD